MGARFAMMRLGVTEVSGSGPLLSLAECVGNRLGFTVDEMSASGRRQQPEP